MNKENEIPLSLVEEFKHNRVALFVGAGISINAGLPSWEELLNYLGKSTINNSSESNKFYASCNYQEKAQYLYDMSDKVTIINTIKDFFSRQEKIENKIYEKIALLPIDTIITTNWDNLLENEFSKKGINFIKIWKDDQISSFTNGCKTIIKLHGTFEDPQSIIFSEDDYTAFYNKNQLMKIFLSTLLARSTILMVGYSYQDANFKVINDFVKNQLRENHKKIYALFLNYDYQRIKYIESRGLICINFNGIDRKSAISRFFETLYDSVSLIADTDEGRLKILKRENGEIAQRYNSLVLRNMAALGPLATPEQTEFPDMFGANTKLQIECANNWRKILEKENSSAKIILCLNDIKAKEVFNKNAYINRIDTLLSNITKYEKKIRIVDIGNPLVMSNFDIYGNIVFLENIKTDINNMGYGYIKVHRDPNIIKMNIELFDRIFESVRALNLIEAITAGFSDNNEDNTIKKLILYRLENYRNKIQSEW